MILKSTRSLIVKTAEELILSHGYQGFSYNDIAQIIKIRKSSIHYHFPAKEDLGIAFINKFSRLFSLWTKRLGNVSNREKIRRFCIMYSEQSQDCTRICPIGMVAAEYNTLPITLQENARELISQVELWLELIIKAGIQTKEFKGKLDPRETSQQIIYVMSGALKMARIFKDVERICHAQETLEMLIFTEISNQGENK